MAQDFVDDPIRLYLAEIDLVPPMDRAEELDCIREVRAGGPQADKAAKSLIENNLLWLRPLPNDTKSRQPFLSWIYCKRAI